MPTVVSYGTFVVLAHFVSPEDLGSITLAVVWIAFWAVFGDLGLGVGLLRQNALRRAQTDAAFRLTVAVGIVLAVLAASSAALMLSLGFWTGVASLAAVLAVKLVTDGFTYIPTSVCQRQFRFRFLAFRDLSASLTAGIVAVVAAVSGAGRWSFVILSLVQGVVTAAFFRYALGPGALRGKIEWAELRTLLPFGRQITFQQFLKFITQSADSVVVGTVLGPSSLGIYRFGQRVAIESSSPVRQGIGAFLLPSLANQGGDVGRRRELTRILHLSLVFLLPWFLILAFTSTHLIPLVFGEKWAPGASVVRILCLAGGLQLLFLPVGEAMKAAGKAKWLIGWTAGLTSILLVAIAIGARAGIDGAAWGVVATYVLFVPLALRLMRKAGGPSVGELLRACSGALVPLLLLTASLLGALVTGAASTTLGLGLTMVVAVSVYVAGLWAFDRGLITGLISGVRGRASFS